MKQRQMMRKWFILWSTFSLLSCEEVIDLELDTAKKQLVVDAALDWEKGTTGQVQKVFLSFSTDFYNSSENQKASGAKVSVNTYDGKNFIFTEENQGEYICRNFAPEINTDYLLNIEYQGNTYTSKARMREMPSVEEKHITQNENAGFLKNEKELKLVFETDPSEENIFLVKTTSSLQKEISIFAISDKFFTKGKMSMNIRGTQLKEAFKAGEELKISIYRISSQYQQIIDHFLSSSLEESNGMSGLFLPPKRILGNIYNSNDPKSPPLGAFRVAQYSEIKYIVK